MTSLLEKGGGTFAGIKMLLCEVDQLKKAEGALMFAAIKGKRDATATVDSGAAGKRACPS